MEIPDFAPDAMVDPEDLDDGTVVIQTSPVNEINAADHADYGASNEDEGEDSQDGYAEEEAPNEPAGKGDDEGHNNDDDEDEEEARRKQAEEEARRERKEYIRSHLHLFGDESVWLEITQARTKLKWNPRSVKYRSKETKPIMGMARDTNNLYTDLYNYKNGTDYELDLEIERMLGNIESSTRVLRSADYKGHAKQMIHDIYAYIIPTLIDLIESSIKARSKLIKEPNEQTFLAEVTRVIEMTVHLCQNVQNWRSGDKILLPTTKYQVVAPTARVISPRLRNVLKTFGTELDRRRFVAKSRADERQRMEMYKRRSEEVEKPKREKRRQQNLDLGRNEKTHQLFREPLGQLVPAAHALIEHSSAEPPLVEVKWSREQDSELLQYLMETESLPGMHPHLHKPDISLLTRCSSRKICAMSDLTVTPEL